MQPQCLQEAQITVQQCNPLLSAPNLLFKCSIPLDEIKKTQEVKKNWDFGNDQFYYIYIIRSSSAAEIVPYCSQIISHSIHDQSYFQQPQTDVTSDNISISFEPQQFRALNFSGQDLIMYRDIGKNDL